MLPLHVEEMLRDADAATYSAKSLGRDQTYVFAEIDDESARIPRFPLAGPRDLIRGRWRSSVARDPQATRGRAR